MNVVLSNVMDVAAFSFRWPEYGELQPRLGGDGLGSRGGRFLHAVGAREAYGQLRPHAVTFLDRQPFIEGVGADDYEQTESLAVSDQAQPRTLACNAPRPSAGNVFRFRER